MANRFSLEGDPEAFTNVTELLHIPRRKLEKAIASLRFKNSRKIQVLSYANATLVVITCQRQFEAALKQD